MKYALPLGLLMALHTIFLMVDAYTIRHLDSAMHFAGGITLGIFVSGLIAHAIGRGWCPDPGKVLRFVLVVSLVTTGAVCWEVYEWLSDHYLGTHFQVSLNDTVKDLVLGMSGAVFYAWLTIHSRTLDEQMQAEGESLRSGD
jgi:ABC-type nitrate/sulfonate/bicarbonate transport system permease component